MTLCKARRLSGLIAFRSRGLVTSRRSALVLVALVWSATIARGQSYDRWVRLQGAVNFRDVGGYDARTGYAVATSRLFRSASLANVTTSDATLIYARGIRHIVDLRTDSERKDYGADSPLLNAFATWRYIPIPYPTTTDTIVAYRQVLRESDPQWKEVFELLADQSNLPLVYHCQAGRDRAGILTALILMLLGVTRETIIEDYLLSNTAYGSVVVNQAWIEAVLDEVNSKGGIDPFLESVGVNKSVHAAVRANLLVPRRYAPARLSWRLYR